MKTSVNHSLPYCHLLRIYWHLYCCIAILAIFLVLLLLYHYWYCYYWYRYWYWHLYCYIGHLLGWCCDISIGIVWPNPAWSNLRCNQGRGIGRDIDSMRSGEIVMHPIRKHCIKHCIQSLSIAWARMHKTVCPGLMWLLDPVTLASFDMNPLDTCAGMRPMIRIYVQSQWLH